ncbi:MAG: helix-turn-helix transcriptional regulator, partial [Burkholderiales bacterium]
RLEFGIGRVVAAAGISEKSTRDKVCAQRGRPGNASTHDKVSPTLRPCGPICYKPSMPNVGKVLKEEITRLARLEVRANLEKTRKSAVRHQRVIANLKGQVRALERQLSVLRKSVAKADGEALEPAPEKPSRFVPKGLVSTRKRLGLSASQLAGIMGVSSQTVYNWERGVTRPRPAQREKLISLRRVGKRQVQAQLAAGEP